MALGYQYVVFEKYRIYDRSLEVRVGRRLAPKSGEEHAAAEEPPRQAAQGAGERPIGT